ncbi:hypothetical protein V5O48_015299 [Marasmius crinis-equi]|uniref:Uncharacterized protein n=1 Tax=Marasmius crinis-equi TaxID=585013 RepID=A0ABR3EUX7_9AGAR
MPNANTQPQGQADGIRSILNSRQTRSGFYYSPYLMSSDVYINPNVTVDALLYTALNLQDDPFGSPLSTPPSSRSASPEPRLGRSAEEKAKRKKKRKNADGDEKAAEEGSVGELAEEGSTTEKTQQRSHVQRRHKRQKTEPSLLFTQSDESLESLARKHAARLFPSSANVKNAHPADNLRYLAQSTAYQGNPFTSLGNPEANIPAPENRPYRLDELVNDGKHNFALVSCKNDGGTAHITCPNTKSVIGMITTGPRKDKTWKSNADNAVKTIKELRPQCNFPPWVYGPKTRRGPINNINWGISLGNGQPEPMELNDQGVKRKAVVEAIRQDSAFVRIALFMTMVFLTWAPKLCLYYATTMTKILEHYPHLSLPFSGCVFAAFAVNFGPQTVCLPHRDTKNLAFGWCAITALGNFDWTKGGHLVLWDLRLVVEFPPGATIFIPSALVCHFNTSIQPHEERYSFTCYTSGALFRWADHGFQPETAYKKTKQSKDNAEQDRTRWEQGMSLFSTLDDLKEACQK